MGGHDVSHIRAGRGQLLHPHAGGVHRHGTELKSHFFEYPVSMLVGGALHSQPSFSQNRGYQHHQIVVSRSQHNLLRTAVDAPGLVKVPADGLPELPLALGIPQLEQLLPIIQQHISCDLTPYAIGKAVQIDAVGRKVVFPAPFFGLWRDFPSVLPGLQMIQPFNPAGIIALAGNRLHIPFRQQLIISQIHSATAYFQITRKSPAGGKLLSSPGSYVPGYPV